MIYTSSGLDLKELMGDKLQFAGVVLFFASFRFFSHVCSFSIIKP